MNTSRTAQQAFEEHRKHAQQALKVISQKLNQNAKNVNWAQVGTMADIDEKLTDLMDMIQGTGEYAE